MKRRNCFHTSLLLAFFLYGNHGYGQSREFHLGISGGLGYALQWLKPSPLVRPLVAFPQQGAMFSGHVHYRWKNGLGLGILVRSIAPPKRVFSAFSHTIEQTFPDDYPTVNIYGGDINDQLDATMQGFVFMSYTISRKDWVFRPRIMAGLTEFQVLSAKVVLKQQSSNQQRILTLHETRTGNSKFYEEATVGVGLAVERSIARHWSIFASTDWTRFSSDMKYQQTIEDQIDGSVTTASLDSHSPVDMLHLSVGILVRWGKRKQHQAE